jgi:hypothetical protein
MSRTLYRVRITNLSSVGTGCGCGEGATLEEAQANALRLVPSNAAGVHFDTPYSLCYSAPVYC